MRNYLVTIFLPACSSAFRKRMSLSKKLPVAVICPVASMGRRCGASICCIFTLARSKPAFSDSAVNRIVQTSPGNATVLKDVAEQLGKMDA